ncbi:MAG TPA: hypothetical protein DHU96_04940 [Actinobacteria bacterium]|nr:hypothetical protein [Actinomycetota bacterium]
MPVPAHPLIAAHDQDRGVGPACFQAGCHPGLHVQVTFTGLPGGQCVFQCRGRIAAERAQFVLLRSGQGEPEADQVGRGVQAERRIPIGGQPLHRRASEFLGGTGELPGPVPGDRHQFGETMPGRLVLLCDPVRLHLGGDQRGAGAGDDSPDQVHVGGTVHWRACATGDPGHRGRAGQDQASRNLARPQPAGEAVPGCIRPESAHCGFCSTERCFVI